MDDEMINQSLTPIIVNQDTVIHHKGKQHYQADSSYQDSNSQSNESSLRQEVLARKKKAVAFKIEGRLEGRTQQADEEFEKAKAIETQLEQLTDSTKSSASGEKHLLSALRVIGLEDSTPSISRSQETLKPPPKVSTDKKENTKFERSRLEERIKVEKVKAVNLKRLGKQGEALDALRRAKLYEK
uniref:Uncharacterized protein n=1 Tax=Cucumis melo TaxID=3656 RepID=A0A9I9CRF8_CUCME